MRKILFTLVLLTTTVSAYSQLLYWNATQNKANAISPKGDANSDGEVDISDVVFVVNEILSGDSYQELCDVNYDGYVDISDVVELVNIILNELPKIVDDTRHLSLYVGQEKTEEISFGWSKKIGSGSYSIQNNVPSVAKVEIKEGKLVITGLSDGLDRFWVTDNVIKDDHGNPLTQMYVVYVERGNLYCPDNNHPHMINLGLPSGTQWACCNVGASSPEEYGGHYAWGETQEKSEYTWENYKNTYYSTNKYIHSGSDISGTQYDVAHVKWGGSWHMPTSTQIKELLDYCSYHYATTWNDEYVGSFTGPNGGNILLPAAGYFSDDTHNYADIMGCYWSSTPYGEFDAFDLNFCFGMYSSGTSTYYGVSVRPVR